MEDLSLGQLEEMQKFGEDEKDSPDILYWMGKNLLRDEDGKEFEDMATIEDVRKLKLSRVKAIIHYTRKQLEASAPGNSPD